MPAEIVALRCAESETRDTNHVNGGAGSGDETLEECENADRGYLPLLKKLLLINLLLLLLLLLRNLGTLMLLPILGLMCVFTLLLIVAVGAVDNAVADDDNKDTCGVLCAEVEILLPTSRGLFALFVVLLLL